MFKRFAPFIFACLFALPASAADFLKLHQGAYDSNAQAYFNTLIAQGCTPPSGAFKQAVSTYVAAEKAAGNWGGQDFAYITTTADSCTASINLAQPNFYQITWNGSCTYSVANGLGGDGSTCYGDTNVNVSALTRVLRDSSHLDACVASSGSAVLGGVAANSDITLSTVTNKTTAITSNAAITDTAGGGTGCHYGVRTSSSVASTGKNGVVQSNGVASTSVALPAVHISLCRSSATFCASTAKIFFAEVGQPLTSDLIHYTNVRTMLVSLGAVGL